MDALRLVEGWPAENVAVAVVRGDDVVASTGDTTRVYEWASITKLLAALAALVAVEEGSIALDDPAGPPGATFRHLLAHASGLPFEGTSPLARVGTRRIYSNVGIETMAAALGRAVEMPFAEYLRHGVLDPLAMPPLEGSPAAGYAGSLDDLVRLARELLAPTLVAPETLAEATTVQFPGLSGVLPAIGRMEPNDWGLGFELRDAKSPHWTGSRNSPRTFGHFGGAGTFLWVDPAVELAVACLTDLRFGDWALEAWPPFSDAVLAELTS